MLSETHRLDVEKKEERRKKKEKIKKNTITMLPFLITVSASEKIAKAFELHVLYLIIGNLSLNTWGLYLRI